MIRRRDVRCSSLRRSFLSATMVLCAASTALACIWDDDTLRMESEGLPGVMKVIAGSFERNPPLYYEMRLERAKKAIAENPADLAAYDNAGAACDRLGKGDEAIAWMERKRDQLDKLAAGAEGPGAPKLKEHRYRYLANVGTFWVHRWLKGGGDRARIEEVERAAEYIQAAIDLNPDAHFGREKYQLRAMKWLIAGEPYVRGEKKKPAPLGDFLGLTAASRFHSTDDRGELKKLGYEDAVEGISGMIVLGAAWESVDMFHALALALQTEGRSSVAHLAAKRVSELIIAGKGSLRPGAPSGADLLASMERWSLLRPEVQKQLDTSYEKAREKTEEWHVRRMRWMVKRLREGRHPDTHPDFWSGWGK